MLGLYRALLKSIHVLLNIMFVLQILFLILVFLTATYWFCDLIEWDVFAFAEPIATAVSNFVKTFYNGDMEIGGIYVDSSLLVFDILSLLLVFALSKIKSYAYIPVTYINKEIEACRKEQEIEFNKDLEMSLERDMKNYRNVALLVHFDVKDLSMNYNWGGGAAQDKTKSKEKQDEVFKLFYSEIKTFGSCKFAKTDDKMLILLNNFDKIDDLLDFINLSISRVKDEMKKSGWLVTSYIAADVYDNKTDFNGEIYPLLDKLVSLRHKDGVICLSSFSMRYQYLENPKYTILMKGKYNINVETQVWTLVKKS